MPANITDVQVKPFNMVEIHELYETGGELDADNVYQASGYTGSATDLKTDIHTLVNAEQTSVNSLKTTAKSDSATDITNRLSTLSSEKSTAATTATTERAGLLAAWPYVDQTAYNAAINGAFNNVDAEIGNIQTGDLGLTSQIDGNIDSIVMDASGLNTDIDSAIDAELSPAGSVLITDVSDYIKLGLEGAITGEGLTFVCPQCGTAGVVATFNPDGSTTGETITCPLCDGNGYTAIQYIRSPVSCGFIPEPA